MEISMSPIRLHQLDADKLIRQNAVSNRVIFWGLISFLALGPVAIVLKLTLGKAASLVALGAMMAIYLILAATGVFIYTQISRSYKLFNCKVSAIVNAGDGEVFGSKMPPMSSDSVEVLSSAAFFGREPKLNLEDGRELIFANTKPGVELRLVDSSRLAE